MGELLRRRETITESEPPKKRHLRAVTDPENRHLQDPSTDQYTAADQAEIDDTLDYTPDDRIRLLVDQEADDTGQPLHLDEIIHRIHELEDDLEMRLAELDRLDDTDPGLRDRLEKYVEKLRTEIQLLQQKKKTLPQLKKVSSNRDTTHDSSYNPEDGGAPEDTSWQEAFRLPHDALYKKISLYYTKFRANESALGSLKKEASWLKPIQYLKNRRLVRDAEEHLKKAQTDLNNLLTPETVQALTEHRQMLNEQLQHLQNLLQTGAVPKRAGYYVANEQDELVVMKEILDYAQRTPAARAPSATEVIKKAA